MIRFSRVTHSTTPPATGTLPPLRPVPLPRTTTGTEWIRASRSTPAISVALAGKTTARGRCFSVAVPSKA